MIKQVTKKEYQKYKDSLRHIRGPVKGGRTFIELYNKVYETTGAGLQEVYAFQKEKKRQAEAQTTLL